MSGFLEPRLMRLLRKTARWLESEHSVTLPDGTRSAVDIGLGRHSAAAGLRGIAKLARRLPSPTPGDDQ